MNGRKSFRRSDLENSFKMTKKEWIDPLEELEAKWDLEMANFPSLQPGPLSIIP